MHYIIEGTKLDGTTVYATGTEEHPYWTKNPAKVSRELTKHSWPEADVLRCLLRHHIKSTKVDLSKLALAVSADTLQIVAWRK